MEQQVARMGDADALQFGGHLAAGAVELPQRVCGVQSQSGEGFSQPRFSRR